MLTNVCYFILLRAQLHFFPKGERNALIISSPVAVCLFFFFFFLKKIDDTVLCGERITVTFSNRSRIEHNRQERREGHGRGRGDRPSNSRRPSSSYPLEDDLYRVPISGLSQDTKWKVWRIRLYCFSLLLLLI